tara:strand:+ start:16611 stop:16802 length:192 start_codon:yes stop_codon:yes gene_type:complete
VAQVSPSDRPLKQGSVAIPNRYKAKKDFCNANYWIWFFKKKHSLETLKIDCRYTAKAELISIL